MKPKEILVFGATGQIGRHLLRKLTRKNFKVTVVTRNLHRKAYILKSQANAGWMNIVELGNLNYEKLSEIFKNKDICINLIGILNENRIFPSIVETNDENRDEINVLVLGGYGATNISEILNEHSEINSFQVANYSPGDLEAYQVLFNIRSDDIHSEETLEWIYNGGMIYG